MRIGLNHCTVPGLCFSEVTASTRVANRASRQFVLDLRSTIRLHERESLLLLEDAGPPTGFIAQSD